MNHMNNTSYRTVKELIKSGEEILRAYEKQDAAIDAKLLAAHLLGCNMSDVVVNRDMLIPDHIEQSYMYGIAKRVQGMPLQYITKNQEFMGLPFYVDERVLIPRQDTEVLVETIIELSKKEPIKHIIDIGTGSGCISVALAHYIKDSKITAIDICPDALEVAKKNVLLNNVSEQITLLESNLFEEYQGEENSVDLIISNPPYISKKESESLMIEVRAYEPEKALTDFGDGLSFYRMISEQSKKYLKPGGRIAYEIGYNQAQEVKDILEKAHYQNITIIKDLSGKDRVIMAHKE